MIEIRIGHVEICEADTVRVLSAIAELKETMMALAQSTQQKLAALTNALTAAKQGLTEDIRTLKDALTAGGGTTAEIDAALDQLSGHVQGLTDLDAANPGGTPPPPPPEPEV